MTEKEKVREREAEQVMTDPNWDMQQKQMQEIRESNKKGRKLIKGSQIPWIMNRQGILKRYVRENIKDIVPTDWTVFVHEIRTHSGKHVHQGGANLFVLKGKGYTVVDGVRFDWSEGDLILLPVKNGGVEHQHFNIDNRPSRWLAFIHYGITKFMGWKYIQKENNPYWKGAPPDV